MPNEKNHIVTAGRFIKYLQTLPPDTPIVLSQDSEGNGYSALTDFGVSGLQDVADLEFSNSSSDIVAKQALVLYPD